MYPIIDLINHANHVERDDNPYRKPNAIIYKSDPKAITMRTQAVYEPGEELFFNYGDNSNRHLLVNYGFVIRKNVNDYFVVDIAYNGQPCLKSAIESESQGCAFHIYPGWIDYDMLDHLIDSALNLPNFEIFNTDDETNKE